MMKLILLSDKFYQDFQNCGEVLKKKNRPYICFTVEFEGHTFAIPLRHHIKHCYSFKTINESGLDFSKSVIIDNTEYISSEQPWIDSREWRIIQKNESKIVYQFKRYIHQYKRALQHPDNPRSKIILKYSSLNHFVF